MFKKPTKALFVFAAVAFMASCTVNEPAPNNSASNGGTTTSSSVAGNSDEAFDPSKPVEISFWHTIGKENQDKINAIITEFNKVYPNITITHTQQGGYDELNEAINNNIAAGNLPTMAYCYEDHVAGYLDHNAVLDMTSYINDSTYGLGHNPANRDLKDQGVEDMSAGYWAAGSQYAVAGHYSVPFSKSTEVMFYNKTAFDANGWAVPETWAEMWDLCETIKANPDYASDDVKCLGYDSDSNMLITMFEQMGLPYTTAAADPATGSHFAFNSQANKDLVTSLKGMYDNKYLVTKGTSPNNAYTSNQFVAGTLLMTIGSTGGTKYNYTNDFEVGVASVPQADKTNKRIISQGPSICFFKRGSTPAQRTAAWLFYKFLTNTNNSAYFGSATGYNPVRDSSYNTHFFTTDMEDKVGAEALVRDTFAYVGNADSGYSGGQFTSPAFKGSAVARKELDGLFPAVCLGTKTVDKAFDDAMSNCLFAE